MEVRPDATENAMINLAIIQQCIIILEDEDPIGNDYRERQRAAKVGELVIKYMNNFFAESKHLDEADKKAFKNFRQATWELAKITETKLIMQENRRKEALAALKSLVRDADLITAGRMQKDSADTAKMGEQLLGITDMLKTLATLAIRAHTLPDEQVDAYNEEITEIVGHFKLDTPITERYKNMILHEE